MRRILIVPGISCIIAVTEIYLIHNHLCVYEKTDRNYHRDVCHDLQLHTGIGLWRRRPAAMESAPASKDYLRVGVNSLAIWARH